MNGTTAVNGTRPAAPWLVGGAVLLLVVAALGTGAGPLLRLGGAVSPVLPSAPGSEPDQPDRRPTRLPDPDPGATRHTSSGYDPLPLLHVVGIVLVTLLALALLALAVLAVRHRLRRQRPAELQPTFTAGGTPPERAELARAVQQADEQLAGDGSPRDRVLRSWLRLEEAVATTGVVRTPGETSAELTRRVLSEHAVAVATLTELHAIYREARYSPHQVAVDVPERAGALLGGIRRDLLGEG